MIQQLQLYNFFFFWFENVQLLFYFVSVYVNQSDIKENKKLTGLKIFKPKKNKLHHNTYIYSQTYAYENAPL